MTMSTSDKEDVIKSAREMMHRNRDNGYILEALQDKYGTEFSDDELKKLITEASK
ncbi:hypothetical protein [Lactobacillus sp. LL6]|uniref:hypothetical protein n=1 Tax=Lactobacillus sp. LL6 TaxID=2596827 RepID=UPI001642B603|nr:hypothetical protein [Lactobacillus sp. LL6]